MKHAVLLAALLGCSAASAHPLSPALLDLRETADGLVRVKWKVSSVRIPGSELRPVLPARCRTASEPEVGETPESITTSWTIDCGTAGLLGQRIGVEGLAAARTDALVRVVLADGSVVQEVARARAPLVDVRAPTQPAAVVSGYLWLGVEHILGGADHLLFVVGLLLLAGGARRVVGTVTAFTLGHSVTLSLAVLGVSNIPPAVAEAAIACTIYALAVELARGADRKETLIRRFPWLMAFAFGLLHGFGFAGALREAGLPPSDVPRALFSFNLGIELGQLAFVAIAAAVGRTLRGVAARLPVWTARVPAYVMGSLAVLWFLERAGPLLH